MKIYDVCIVGGGAAGLITAASLHKDIKKCILEKNNIPGRKLAATGGGRCNITNKACRDKDLALDFFKSHGLETYADSEGRYYPYSNRASDVVHILTEASYESGTDIFVDFNVKKIEVKDGYFIISSAGKKQTIKAQNVVLAAGGKAAPQMGTTGDGFILASSLGHTIEKVYPILTGIECGSFEDIKGVRAKGRVSLYKDDNLIDSETGEIQFTEDGISGICVFNLTLNITSEKGEDFKTALKRYCVELDLAPDFTVEELTGRKSSFGILSRKLSEKVKLKDIKSWRLPIKGVKGWKTAQCTGGGIKTDEVNMNTMESKLVPGLYITGETLNVQGPCGGFNLQFAWETGLKAAKALNGKFI